MTIFSVSQWHNFEWVNFLKKRLVDFFSIYRSVVIIFLGWLIGSKVIAITLLDIMTKTWELQMLLEGHLEPPQTTKNLINSIFVCIFARASDSISGSVSFFTILYKSKVTTENATYLYTIQKSRAWRVHFCYPFLPRINPLSWKKAKMNFFLRYAQSHD